jgi:ribosomal protein S18 acetylase RimI-like enzyme
MDSRPLSIDCEPLAEGEALALAAQAWPPAEREGQLAAVRQQAGSESPYAFLLLAGRRGSQLAAAMLGQQLVGRAATLWPPQLAAGESARTAPLLLESMHRQLAAGGVELVQLLLESRTAPAAELLAHGGYQHAGDLAYLVADASVFPTGPPRLKVELEGYSPEMRDRFVGVIEASYAGSLDCPLVDGLRRTEDVLAGYQAVGQFRPDHWLLARLDGRDVGCLLVADHSQQQQLELVYLGVVPQARGQGLGRALTRHAQWLARQAGRTRVVLAVDAANQPALGGYRACGFAAWDQRSVFVRSLRTI